MYCGLFVHPPLPKAGKDGAPFCRGIATENATLLRVDGTHHFLAAVIIFSIIPIAVSNRCFKVSTGANRSPRRAKRSGALRMSNWAGESPRVTSFHRSGVET